MTGEHDQRIAELIRALIVEADLQPRSRPCDAWSGAFLEGQLEAGADPMRTELLCAELVAGAVAAADVLVARAAERTPGETLH